MESCDLLVVGAGIVGLAHALAGIRRGLRVMVVERDARASEASVRNFGFVTITGQAHGVTRNRALRSRDVWAEIAPRAGIPIHQRGALVAVRRQEAMRVLEEYAAGPGGEGCDLWDADRTRRELAMVDRSAVGALWSPHELRIEARDALPRLAAWLEGQGVEFRWKCAALRLKDKWLDCSAGGIDAGAIVFAPGHATGALFPSVAEREALHICKLQMMRLGVPAWRLPGVAMSDLSLIRYDGFAMQPSTPALRSRLEAEAKEELELGIHLIVAQAADGSLLVGDSHAYGDNADPFADERTDFLVLEELKRLFGAPPQVIERWNGYYPVAATKPLLRERVGERARLVVVTSGTGMSTAFAIGEETVAELFG